MQYGIIVYFDEGLRIQQNPMTPAVHAHRVGMARTT